MSVVIIPEKLNKDLKKISNDFGISESEVMTNAFLYYLKNIKNKTDLQKELTEWDNASSQDLINFEKKWKKEIFV